MLSLIEAAIVATLQSTDKATFCEQILIFSVTISLDRVVAPLGLTFTRGKLWRLRAKKNTSNLFYNIDSLTRFILVNVEEITFDYMSIISATVTCGF